MLLEHRLFDFPQAANLAAHLNLGVTIGLQYRFGHIAEEVVVAVTMRCVGKLRRDSRHERILLILQPQRHRLVQRFGPLFGLGD